MGLFIKLMMFLVVLALAAPFVMKGPDGKPLMTLDDIKIPDISMPEEIKQLPGKVEDMQRQISNATQGDKSSSGNSSKVYSWVDEQGNQHYSNTPPAAAKDVTTREYRHDANVISLKPDENKTAEQANHQKSAPKQSASTSVSDLYSPGGVKKLIDDARAIEGSLQQRKESYDQAIDR